MSFPWMLVITFRIGALDWLIWGLVALSLVLWAITAWLRVYRLTRYFQLEGYDSKRYSRWLIRQRRELFFLLTNVAAAVLIVMLSLWEFANRAKISRSVDLDLRLTVFGWAFVPALLSGLSAVYHLVSRPREREVKQRFTPTSRALRLLGTALVIDALPLAILAIWLVLNVHLAWNCNDTVILRSGVPEECFISIPWPPLPAFSPPVYFWGPDPKLIIAWIALTGPLLLLIAPLTLPLANAISWPIEEAFRRYYLRLAKQHLKRSGATVIAITGSYGKTSTKHYLNHILGARYRTLMTPKSYNTLLGISRVINDILAKDISYDYFIVEAGAYIPGEIARICKLVEPKISMVVTVGPMHLERFGSIENVVKAKYEIVEALPPDGMAVFNADDSRVLAMAERGYPQNRILITQEGAPGARLAASNVRMTGDGLDFDVCDNQTGEQRAMHAPLYGEHNVTNILMAMAVARYLGMSLAEIAMRVATLEPAEHRLVRRVLADGTVLIDDAYSANPSGTQTALDVLALQKVQPNARRIVVSSGMFELGPLHEEENRRLGERIAAVATDVILIGPEQTKPVQAGLAAANFPADHLHVVNTLSEAVEIYKSLLRPGDALLVLTDLPDTYA